MTTRSLCLPVPNFKLHQHLKKKKKAQIRYKIKPNWKCPLHANSPGNITAKCSSWSSAWRLSNSVPPVQLWQNRYLMSYSSFYLSFQLGTPCFVLFFFDISLLTMSAFACHFHNCILTQPTLTNKSKWSATAKNK